MSWLVARGWDRSGKLWETTRAGMARYGGDNSLFTAPAERYFSGMDLKANLESIQQRIGRLAGGPGVIPRR